MYLEGVGWVTIDVYPEHSDEPPPPPIDDDLESTLGELARKDPTGGKAADPHTHLHIPWEAIFGALLAFLGSALAAAYAMKLFRQLRRGSTRTIYIGVLDRLSDLGLPREPGETRERHAQRIAQHAPSFGKLTREHLREALGGKPAPLPSVRDLARHTRRELRRALPLWRRVIAALDPAGWLRTR